MLAEYELDNLLVDELDLGFYFLTDTPKIVHYGYLGKFNCGDDAFVDVFKYLHKKYYPHCEITYRYECSANDDLVILGGGDVINPYFVDKIKHCKTKNVIAVGIGLPYLSLKGIIQI
jgi:hypothetical protein